MVAAVFQASDASLHIRGVPLLLVGLVGCMYDRPIRFKRVESHRRRWDAGRTSTTCIPTERQRSFPCMHECPSRKTQKENTDLIYGCAPSLEYAEDMAQNLQSLQALCYLSLLLDTFTAQDYFSQQLFCCLCRQAVDRIILENFLSCPSPRANPKRR